MGKKGSVKQEEVGPGVIRSENIVQLFDQFQVTDTIEHASEGLCCRAYREFLLYLGIDSTLTPTTLQIKVEFLDPNTGKYHTYKQGPFASLFYEDQDTANGIHECFSGECVGSDIRVTLTGVGTTTSAYFTTDVSIEFRN